MASHSALDSPDSYMIAWIAALPIDRAAAEAMLMRNMQLRVASLDTQQTRMFIRGVA